MPRVEFDKNFLKQVKKLDIRLQKKLSALLALLAQNPYNPRLHTKHLSEPLSGVLSFRITRDWRVTFHFVTTDTIRILEVRHRKDIYR